MGVVKMQTKTKAWLNLILLIATLGVNYLGGSGMINDSSQSEVSAEYQSLITPAGFAFSIWGLIYGLLVISMIVMLVKYNENYYKQAIERISPYFWMSSVFNMVWIFTFSYYQIGISTLFIFGYLFSLTRILQLLLGIHKEKRWLLPITFGLNTGWLFIASVVNVAAFLQQIEWDGLGLDETTWAMIMLSISLLLCIGVAAQLRNAAFPLPIAWAYFGIYQELQGTDSYRTVAIIALVGVGCLVALAIYLFKRNANALMPE